jgi:MinD-like ATPase involved in chromosome partitioning or flagellar assembly
MSIPEKDFTAESPASSESKDEDATPGMELVVADKRRPVNLTLFGGHIDRTPVPGSRRWWLYEKGINVGPTNAEIIQVERQACAELREVLRRIPGALCIGFFSVKGGAGKSTLSTLILQLLHILNPVRDKAILIDVNTSQTTLDELNGLKKEDFLSGKFWTMETLWAFLDQHPNLDKLTFDEINAKLAYRKNPQLPMIPLVVEASEFEEDESKFAGAQYLQVLEILKRFFTVIVTDFGTETKVKLTQEALAQQPMLGVLTHSGRATTKTVGNTLEMLHLNMVGLLLNTVVIFNVSQQPSRTAAQAVELEKSGKTRRARKILRREPSKDSKDQEIQTPGQAIRVINSIIEMRRLISALEPEDIVMVGFDPHLSGESELRLSKVSVGVQAQLWMVLHRLLQARVEYEKNFLGLSPGRTNLRREQMIAELDSNEPDRTKQTVIFKII